VLAGGVAVLDAEFLFPAHVKAKTTMMAAMMMMPPKTHPLRLTRALSSRRWA
jgi:hypothetical protein